MFESLIRSSKSRLKGWPERWHPWAKERTHNGQTSKKLNTAVSKWAKETTDNEQTTACRNTAALN